MKHVSHLGDQCHDQILPLQKTEYFDQKVPVNLHKLQPYLWSIYIIDEFTYCEVAIISSKSMSTKAELKNWIAIFRVPKKSSVLMEKDSLVMHFMRRVKGLTTKSKLLHHIVLKVLVFVKRTRTYH